MKKLLHILISGCLIVVFAATPCLSTTWYACAGSRNISDAATWEDAVGCDGNVLTWNDQAAGDIFEANGQTGLVVDVNPKGTGGSAGKVHLKTTAGGGFTYNVNTQDAITIDADITAGTTDCLVVSGAGSAGTELTIIGNITGGGSLNADGVADSHTGAGAIVDVQGSVTGGGNTTANGYLASGATGTVQFSTGTYTAATGSGIRRTNGGVTAITGTCVGGSDTSTTKTAGCMHAGTGTFTITGSCQGSASASPSPGCMTESTGTITVTGNLIATANGLGAAGKIDWAPGDTTPPSNYVQIWSSGADFYYMTPNPEPAVADVKTGVTYGWDGSDVYTGTLASGSGGGAWSF